MKKNVKFKPVFNFQSVEFEVTIETKKDLDEAFDFYKECLDRLMELAPEQANRSERNSSINREPKATEKQREIMRAYGIKFTSDTTQRQASMLIEESMNKSR